MESQIVQKKRAPRVLKWFLVIFLGFYLIFVFGRIMYSFRKDKTDEQIAKIHSSAITFFDVVGENLPPHPGEEGNKTVSGIDVNQNGIRDDVELAIFEKYPDSLKTRAELLQYAFALQAMTTQSFVNEDIVTSIIQEKSRAYDCIGESLSRDDINMFYRETTEMAKFVENIQINTQARERAEKSFYKLVGSYNESQKDVCDIKI